MSFPSDPPYVIAEIGGNHGGDVATAKRYLRAAADSGADAAKFQYYQAEWLIDENEPPLPLAGDEYETQFERFKKLELAREEWEELVALADDLDIDFAASVFDREVAAFVADHSPFLKIASGDLTNIPLLRYASSLDIPIVLSTGFSTWDEIDRAVAELGGADVTLLHCIGSYPTDLSDANLQMIDHLDERYDVDIGYSDHTIGTEVPTAAVARGATIVEKHFTLDKSQEVGDHRLSATPAELEELVEAVNGIWEMFGDGDRSSVFEAETDIDSQMRRSLATRRRVERGQEFTEENLTALRPDEGISPLDIDDVVGETATRDLPAREILHDDDVDRT